jgi:hypothetical protein
MATSIQGKGVKEVLNGLLLGYPMVKAGRMLRYPTYYVKGKLLTCLYGDGMGLKAPEQLANELLEEEAIIPFEPMGRNRMREWIQINRASPADYMDDKETLDGSAAYVASLAE